MKFEVTPTTARMYVPIYVNVSGVQSPNLWVADQSHQTMKYSIPLKMKADRWEANTWFEKPGTYEITLEAVNVKETKTIQIQPQEYLSFSKEFGIFLFELSIVLTGVFIWIRRVRKRAAG